MENALRDRFFVEGLVPELDCGAGVECCPGSEGRPPFPGVPAEFVSVGSVKFLPPNPPALSTLPDFWFVFLAGEPRFLSDLSPGCWTPSRC